MPAPSGLSAAELIAGYLGKVPIDVGLGIVLEVAWLLGRAHLQGNVHGSLSTHAIWLSAAGEVWLDWHPQKSPEVKSMPPEARRGEPPSCRGDVYSLGATAYELLTGLSISRAWAKQPLVVITDVASPREFNAAVPDDIDALVAACLSRNPYERPERVETLAAAAECAVDRAKWPCSLGAMLADPFFEPALRHLPLTCERAGGALPELLPEPEPTRRLSVVPPPSELPHDTQVQEEPTQETSTEDTVVDSDDDDDDGARRPVPMVKIMIVTALAAVASLAVCLAVAHVGPRAAPGRVAAAARGLALAPAVVLAPIAPTPAVEAAPLVFAAVQKVKAERPRATKRGAVSHRKRHR